MGRKAYVHMLSMSHITQMQQLH